MHSMLPDFSQALGLNSSKSFTHKVSPHNICTLADESMDSKDHEAGPGDELEEGRAITGRKMVYQPSKEERDAHMSTHIPFRSWCPCCVKGKSPTGTHKSSAKETHEIPSMRWDYMGPKSKEDKSEKIDSLPI